MLRFHEIFKYSVIRNASFKSLIIKMTSGRAHHGGYVSIMYYRNPHGLNKRSVETALGNSIWSAANFTSCWLGLLCMYVVSKLVPSWVRILWGKGIVLVAT